MISTFHHLWCELKFSVHFVFSSSCPIPTFGPFLISDKWSSGPSPGWTSLPPNQTLMMVSHPDTVVWSVPTHRMLSSDMLVTFANTQKVLFFLVGLFCQIRKYSIYDWSILPNQKRLNFWLVYFKNRGKIFWMFFFDKSGNVLFLISLFCQYRSSRFLVGPFVPI